MARQTSTQRGSAPKGRSQQSARNVRSSAANDTKTATGERDEVYGLVSVMYHALQGAETCAQYLQDAQRAGDEELVEFFEECQAEDIDRADRARGLLAARIQSDGIEDEDEDEDEESDGRS